MIEPYEDPNHEGNSSQYHTGKVCIEQGCDKPAGTAWSPLWCFEHNVERIHRIDAGFASVLQKYNDTRQKETRNERPHR